MGAVVFVMALACTSEGVDHLRFGHKYVLSVLRVERNSTSAGELTVHATGCRPGRSSYRDDLLSLCIYSDASGIDIEFKNLSPTPVSIDIRGSRYLDENEQAHEVQEKDGQTIEIKPGDARFAMFAPKGKSYRIRSSWMEEVPYVEPIIPISFAGLNATKTEELLDRLSAERREVGVDVLVRIPGSEPRTYSPRLVLKPRYTSEEWEEIRPKVLESNSGTPDRGPD